MPSTPRPRGSSGGPHSSPRTTSIAPMSERQQMALLMQMTSQTNQQSAPAPQQNQSSRGRVRNERGETPLHVAAIKGDQDQVKKFLEQGMDPNITDYAGWTPLHEACSYGWYQVVVALVKAGANVNAKGPDHDTPLHDATTNGHLKMVKFLIEQGADPYFKNQKGKTPMDYSTPTVLTYLQSLKDTSARSTHGSKKGSNASGSHISQQEGGSSSSSKQRNNMEGIAQEENKDNTSATPEKTNTANNDKKETDTHNQLSSAVVSSSTQDDTLKRSIYQMDPNENEQDDETSKKKKKKEEPKETMPKPSVQPRTQTGRGLVAGSKPPGPASKTGATPLGKAALGQSTPTKSHTTSNTQNKSSNQSNNKNSSTSTSTSKSSSNPPGSSKSTGSNKNNSGAPKGLERKSPVASPKNKESHSNDDKEEEVSKKEEFTGLKVPPLKIVIPGGVGSGSQQEDNSGQRGGSKGRNSTSTLPYVIPFSADDDDDKKSDSTSGSTGQRVLRSHRTNDGDKESTPASPANNKTPPLSTSGHDNDHPSTSSSSSSVTSSSNQLDLHPRKRKIKRDSQHHNSASSSSETVSGQTSHTDHHVTTSNPYQQYIHIRKQIDQRQKNLFPVQPKPPEGFKDYLMNRGTYTLQNTVKPYHNIIFPSTLPPAMRDEYSKQEQERHEVRLQHNVEKEKLVLSVEQEILRVHGRAARALANQSLPFSVCTLLRDREVYNILTPEQEEKERNAQRSRYNGRLFISWLQDVDDKWEKIKEGMVRRHHNEAESLHAKQKMDWEWKLQELGLCDHKTRAVIDPSHVPPVHVSDDFDLLPA